MVAFKLATMLSEPVEAIAFAQPVRVSVQETDPETDPDEFNDAALQVAVTPVGNPEATLMDDPVAPAGRTTPPVGVTVTTAVAVASDCIEMVVGEAAIVTPAGFCTTRVTALDDVSPSPVAVSVSVDEPAAAVVAATSVNVSAVELTPVAEVRGLADHVAVTPVGRVETVKATLPV